MNNIINNSASPSVSPRKRTMTRSTKRLIFYTLLLIIPVVQFIFFYLYINLNSILMAFKEYDGSKGTMVFAGFKYFGDAIKTFVMYDHYVGYSFALYAVNLVIVLGLALVFSYYIAKNFPLSTFFRVVLYLPQIVASIVFVKLYRTLANDVCNTLFGTQLLGGNASPTTQFITVLIFNVWLGFGTNVMLFTGSMSSISPSVLESAQIDGVNTVQEFIHITIPSIWGTFVTFVVVGLSQLFLNQMHLFSFYGSQGVEFGTFGYFFYKQAQTYQNETDLWQNSFIGAQNTPIQTLSALGVMITVVLVPVTLGVKRLLEKYGPSVD